MQDLRIIHMSSDDFELNQKSDKISVKKSSFNGLIIGIIVAVGIAAFFAGTSFSSTDSDSVSEKDLEDAIAKLELKILKNQLNMAYYTAKVQLTTMVDTPKGTKEKKATEIYLVEALSVTEAEAKVVRDFKGVTIDFEVKAVTNSKIIKIIY